MPRTPSPAAPCLPPLIYREHLINLRFRERWVCSRKIGLRPQSFHALASGSIYPPLREFRAGKDGPK